MKLKKGDYVRLCPNWSFADTIYSPKWGGIHGYLSGTVLKTATGDHDVTKHFAEVVWTNGQSGNYQEETLAVMTNDERDIEADFRTGIGVDQDIWCLIKTSAHNFALNVIESNPLGIKHSITRFISGVTRTALPSVDNSDYNLAGMMLQSPDWTEYRTSTLWTAAANIYTMWDLPDLDVLPLPLKEFASIREAADTCPKTDGAAIMFFHLPRNLVDYADMPPRSPNSI